MAVTPTLKIDRVMIGEHEATSVGRAIDEYQMIPDVVFVRDDGWALGAPAHLEAAARYLWANRWVRVFRRVDGGWQQEGDHVHAG